MRTSFINTLSELAETNDNIVLLTADLGYKLFDEYRQRYPNNFINIGVAEQNMIGVASGLALEGKIVYCYSMVPFLTFRALEQIRVDLCYQNLGVTLVGVGGGLTYGLEGMTHHALEDLAIMRALPNMTVVAPGDPIECNAITKISTKQKGPLYIRLGGNNDPVVHNKPIDFQIGKGIVIEQGRGPCIIATGSMLLIAKQVTEYLRESDIPSTLVSMPTLKPFDEELIDWCSERCKYLITIEEHSEIGGLGSATTETLFRIGWKGRFLKIALPDQFCKVVGNTDYLRKRNGLSSEIAFDKILQLMK